MLSATGFTACPTTTVDDELPPLIMVSCKKTWFLELVQFCVHHYLDLWVQGKVNNARQAVKFMMVRSIS